MACQIAKLFSFLYIWNYLTRLYMDVNVWIKKFLVFRCFWPCVQLCHFIYILYLLWMSDKQSVVIKALLYSATSGQRLYNCTVKSGAVSCRTTWCRNWAGRLDYMYIVSVDPPVVCSCWPPGGAWLQSARQRQSDGAVLKPYCTGAGQSVTEGWFTIT